MKKRSVVGPTVTSILAEELADPLKMAYLRRFHGLDKRRCRGKEHRRNCFLAQREDVIAALNAGEPAEVKGYELEDAVFQATGQHIDLPDARYIVQADGSYSSARSRTRQKAGVE